MSDVHSNQEPSLKGTKGQDIEPSRQEIDADRVTCSSDYHQQHEFRDSKHWHAACWARDCRLGFPECKVGSSCSKPGWKNALEEPLRRSRSLAPASRRLESVAMLPSLLSNLAVPVSRTRSDPCIFGKDFLRITLPLPGEPSDCGAQGHAVDQLESSAFENMVSCETTNFVGLATREENPILEASTLPFNLKCEKNIPKTGVSSGNDSLFIVQTSVALTLGVDESIHNIARPTIDDSKEHRVLASDITSLSEDEISQDFGVIFSDKTPTEVNAGLGGWSMRDSACDDGEEESIFYAKQSGDGEEELPKREMDTDNSSKGCKEDDIWSDEHFVSSQVKGFPPPISILANETHPGLPGHMPRTLWRSVKRDGRFVLQEVQAQPREFFRATREFGRLRLQLVRPDSDPVGNYTEAVDMHNKDSAGAVSIACSRSIGNLAEISDSNKAEDCGIVHKGDTSGTTTEGNLAEISDSDKAEDCGIVHKGDTSGTTTEGIDTLQPEDCWAAEKGSKSEAALDHDGSKLVGGLMPSPSLPNECGSSVLERQTRGACSGQNCTEIFGLRPSSDAGLKEVPGLTGGDLMIEVSCVTNPCHISEESQGGKIALDEALGKSTIHIITHESRSPDLGQREVVKVSKVDNREKPFSCCPSDDVLAVGITLDTGHKPIVGQIDGEHKVERIGVANLCTKLDVGQVDEVEDLGICNHSNVVMPATVDEHEEQFRQDYQHPCFNTTYGFDNNLSVLSPSQAFMQFPIQSAVR